MKRKAVSLDIDGVLLNMEQAWLDWLQMKFPTQVPNNGKDFARCITEWDIGKLLGLSSDSLDDLWDSVYKQPLQAYPEAPAVVMSLRSNYDVFFITARSTPEAQSAALRDMKQWFGAEPADILFSEAKNSKNKVLRALDIYAHLDDKWEMAQNAGRFCRSFLLDRPWNQSYGIESTYQRVRSYDEFLQELQQ